MERLSEKEWKPVSLGEVYNNYHGKRLTKEKRISGTTPLLTAGESNNGVAEFISNANMPQYSKFVSVDMFGNSFFHPYRATGDDNIYFFENLHLTAETKEFTCVSIEKQSCKFSYGKQFRQRNADSLKTMLPVTDSGEPDYAYMAEYVQQKRAAMLDKYHKYVEARIEELGELVEIPVLGKKEWKPFSIVELFPKIIPGRGKGLNHLPKVNTGGVNYIGATNRNNGVLCYVEEDDYSRPMILDGNCIGFIKNGDGSAGFAIYKAEKFISTSDVLYGYADWLNRFTGIFFVTAQDMIEHKYSHGYKRNKEHLAGDKVMLPIDDSGEPDYAYMEQYAKNMMLRKYQQYLEFINRQNVAEVE